MFEIGDKVVCVDDSPHQGIEVSPLKSGVLYVIRAVYAPCRHDRDPSVNLIGIPMPPHPLDGEFSWLASRFRKLSDLQAESRNRQKQEQPIEV